MVGMRNEIVTIARRWIGTPYIHQASFESVGTDCLGLIRGIWREAIGKEPWDIPAYTDDWLSTSKDEHLLEALTEHFVQVVAGLPGDVVVFRMRTSSAARHLAILTERNGVAGFVHAYSRIGVVESQLSPPWRRRVAGFFRFPDGS